MSTVIEAAEVYRIQRKAARRYAAEHGESGGSLPILETLLPNFKELNTVSLGLTDAPLNRVRGTLSAGRAAAFAGSFLPLLPEKSEFATKWITLYASHVRDGIRDACEAYEYLGYYYIIEGHKRVSVLTASGASSVTLDVQRIIPPDDSDDENILIYKEFLNIDNRLQLRGMWFSKHGSFTALYGIALSEYGESEAVERLFDAFHDFRMCYRDLGMDALTLTTGDAFLEFAKVYGVPYRFDPDELREKIEYMGHQLLYLSGTPAPPMIPLSLDILDCEKDALRTQLESDDTLFFLRSRARRADILPTFYGRMDEPAFVLGAIAGSLTVSGIVGIAGDTEGAEAFERGVKMVGARNKTARASNTAELRGSGADTALIAYSESCRGPKFPGIYARLAGLTNGRVTEYYAAAAWDFGALRRYVGEDFSGLPKGYLPASEPLHIELGLESGLLKIHLNFAALSEQTYELAAAVEGYVTEKAKGGE